MVSFYNFYITWTILIGFASTVSLGFLIKYDTTKQLAPAFCNGTISSYNFNLYNLMYFCLVVRILFSLIQIITYCKTYEDEKSILRKVINFVMFVFYTISITGLILSAVKLHDNYTDCYEFYTNNDSYLIKSYIILCVVYIIETLGTIIVGLSTLCNYKSKSGYEHLYY
jgi:hypothetical protein